MKKLIQVCIVLAIAFALLVGLFQIAGGSPLAGGGNACRVGWNTRTGDCLAAAPSLPIPPIKPLVGWNS